MAGAIRSLPVPVSPSTKTVESVAATRLTSASTDCRAGLFPMIPMPCEPPVTMTVFGFIYFLFALGLIRCCLATDQKKLLPIRSATYWTEDGIISTDSERAAGRPFERQAASDGAERSRSHA